jgi:phage shock protein A
MTVTAKLSQAFYDRLGHQVADEMVDWFNQVDAAYRSDLRELNELNFARFDAKLEQRFAESALALDQRFAKSALALEQRLSEFARGIEQQITRLALDLKSLEVTLMRQQVIQMRWMIGMWLAVFLAVIGLWVRR